MTPDECAFHARLDDAIRARGSRLALVTHHPPRCPSAPTTRLFRTGWNRWADFPVPPRVLRLWASTARCCWRERSCGEGFPSLTRTHSYESEGLAASARFYSNVLDEIAPGSCIIWNGQHPQEMILASLCSQRGIPIVHVERGPFPGTLHPDEEGVLGGSSVASMREWPAPDETALAVFGRVTKHLNAGSNTWWEQPDPLGPQGVRAAMGIPKHARVALFFGQVDEDAQNILHAPAFSSNLDAFDAWVRTVPREGWFVLGKHHPKSSAGPERYRDALRDAGVVGVWTDELSMIDALCIANRATAVNSSALYESLLVGLPVQLLGRAVLSGKGIAFGMDEPFFEFGACEHEVRAERWRSFGAWFLSSKLCAMDPLLTELGVPGPALLAEMALGQTRSVQWSA